MSEDVNNAGEELDNIIILRICSITTNRRRGRQ